MRSLGWLRQAGTLTLVSLVALFMIAGFRDIEAAERIFGDPDLSLMSPRDMLGLFLGGLIGWLIVILRRRK